MVTSRATRRIAATVVCAAALALLLARSPAAAAPAPFQPWAVSFISPSTGFVLGGERCRFANGAQRNCRPVVAATSDGGAKWRRVEAPPTLLQPVLLSDGNSTVRAITFADLRNGWLYGGGLWATHDGRAHWTRIVGETFVNRVVVSGRRAYAITLNPAHIVPARSPVGRDDWQPVPSSPKTSEGNNLTIAASSSSAFVGLNLGAQGANEPWTTSNGTHWQRLRDPCRSGGPLAVDAASSPHVVFLSCSGGPPTTTAENGLRIHAIKLPGPLQSDMLASPSGQPGIVVTAAPDHVLGFSLPPGRVPTSSWLYRSTTGGHAWTTTSYHDRGAGFADLQFVTATVGWVVHGYPGGAVDQLLKTTDAGATFTPVVF